MHQRLLGAIMAMADKEPSGGKRVWEGETLDTLQELLEFEGVVAAVEFRLDGSLVDYEAKMDMSEEMAQMTAQYCAAVSLLFNTLASPYSIT